MISLPKTAYVQPIRQQIPPFPLHPVAAHLKPYFEYKTIYTLSKPCVVAASSLLKQAMHSQITPPRKRLNIKNRLTNIRKITQARYLQRQKKNNYVDKMDCSSSCCCGCKLENVDARKSGGKVCWKRLKTFTIRFLVSSVASSVPLHKTYRIHRLENKPFRGSFMTVEQNHMDV